MKIVSQEEEGGISFSRLLSLVSLCLRDMSSLSGEMSHPGGYKEALNFLSFCPVRTRRHHEQAAGHHCAAGPPRGG